MCEVKYKVTFGFKTPDYHANFEVCRDLWAVEQETNPFDSKIEAMQWALSKGEGREDLTFDVVTVITPVVKVEGQLHPYLEAPIGFESLDALKRAMKDLM